MSSKKVCEICKFSEDDLLNLGEMKSLDGYSIHIFCGLFSRYMVQRGTDSQGIDGFLIPDIKAQGKRHTKTRCVYCRKTSASVWCCHPQCTRYFHVKCGMEKNCLFQFESDFRVYCHHHVQIEEKIGIQIHADWWKCQICKEQMGPYNPITSIPSCCNQGFVHKRCAQLHARSAGYLTKCPCCGDVDDETGKNYREFLAQRGIFCPDKDADWELSKDAYNSLLFVYKRCDAENCLCPNGREHNSVYGDWHLLKCRYCGESGIHKGCRQTDIKEKFSCNNCNGEPTRSPLITVFTENSRSDAQITNDNIVDDDVKPSTSKTHINNDENIHKQQRKRELKPEADESERLVFKLCETDQLTYRKTSLVLTDQNTNVDPLCDAERSKMRENRLDMFFAKADFDAKPPKLPWIV